MSHRHEAIHAATTAVLEGLPQSHYTTDYQPDYTNAKALYGAVYEMHDMDPLTTLYGVRKLQSNLTAVVVEGNRPTETDGRCAEPVDANMPISVLTSGAVASRAVVQTALPGALWIPRMGGQGCKPRTSATEQLPDGTRVVSYMGDGINGIDPEDRAPDPSRMVAMALQARDLRADLAATFGEPVAMAHEALLLPYEGAFLHRDPDTGELFDLSSELLWAGVRTNRLDGPHIQMLSQIANPVGVKIGPGTSPEYIDGVNKLLNPRDIPGKLTFMLRTSPRQVEDLRVVAGAIRRFAPNAHLQYDIHGLTRPGPNGTKLRVIPELVADVQQKAEVLGKYGLRLHGVNLETTPDHTRYECVDSPDEIPTHPGGVDPQLNPRQHYTVLRQVAPYLPS